MRKLHELLTLLLLLILPVQGFAAAYAPMHKTLGTQTGAAMPCHEQQPQSAHHAGHQAADPSADASTTGAKHDTDSTSHLCCQQVFTGATSSAFPNAAHKFSGVSRLVFPLVTLFIPDSPDRPPRG